MLDRVHHAEYYTKPFIVTPRKISSEDSPADAVLDGGCMVYTILNDANATIVVSVLVNDELNAFTVDPQGNRMLKEDGLYLLSVCEDDNIIGDYMGAIKVSSGNFTETINVENLKPLPEQISLMTMLKSDVIKTPKFNFRIWHLIVSVLSVAGFFVLRSRIKHEKSYVRG